MSATTASLGFSDRWAAYAREQGMDEEDALASDRRRYPGGCMTGFLIWSGNRVQEWRAATGYRGPIGPEQEEQFSRWLERRQSGAIAPTTQLAGA